MSDRDITHLTPDLRALCITHVVACTAAGLDVFVCFTRRSRAEQDALYAQGREDLGKVNCLRDVAEMRPITEAENAYRVTWTLNSKHLAGPDGLARAYDIAIRDASGVFWDAKRDGNQDGTPDYLQAANIGRSLGLECGFFWGHPDAGHYQLDRIGA